MEITAEYLPRFKELNAENLKIMCNGLERRVPSKEDIIPEIASTILRCRSGLIRRKDRSSSSSAKKEETWLLFLGNDAEGKERIARELAGVVFGSYGNITTRRHSSFSFASSDDSTDDVHPVNKRPRAEASHSYIEGVFEAVRENPHRVIVMEDIEQVDYRTRAGIKKCMETGKILSSNGEEVRLCDAIVILSCESFDSRSRACSPPVKHKAERGNDEDDGKEEEDGREKEVGDAAGACLSLDLNLCTEEVQVEEGEEEEEDFFDNGGLVEAVDRAFFFRVPVDI